MANGGWRMTNGRKGSSLPSDRAALDSCLLSFVLCPRAFSLCPLSFALCPFHPPLFQASPLILHALGSHTSPKRKRGPQPIPSLALRAGVSPPAIVSFLAAWDICPSRYLVFLQNSPRIAFARSCCGPC